MIWYEHINNSHAKKEMSKKVVRKIYSEKKKDNLQTKKKEREDAWQE